jgi:cell division protein FtsI (penicillin-binding protein 3)
MYESESTKRVQMIARVALVWAAILVVRLIHLQIISHGEFVRLAQQQHEKPLKVEAPRGTIFDRSGIPLAKSLPVDSVCVNPKRIPDLSVAAQILAGVLDLDATTLYAKLRDAAGRQSGFMWVKRRISIEESKRLRSMKLDWIELRAESHRFYTNGQLASHVVGSVDFDQQGNSGLELSLNDDLQGVAGEMTLLRDVKDNAYASEVESKPVPGKDVTTTIDSRIQFVAERAIAAAAVSSHAHSGSVVVINPRNGEVLAMANYPTFDPNEPSARNQPITWRNNLAITSPYEPGSVFKVVTLSAALETTSMRPATVVNCGNGVLRLGSRTIHEAHHGYGLLSMADVLARSSNIGAIQIGLRVGSEKMYEYMRRLGFGSDTGVPLPSESGGVVRKLSRWGSTSLASMSMGHEVSVTAVQLAQLCSIIANGGLRVQPKLILKKQRPGEAAEIEADAKPVRVLRPETAITMRKMMEGVVILPYGTGHRTARLSGYTSGGKTGTAQIYDFATHQYTHHYNGSFIGFAPVTNPAIAIAVTLNGTSGTAGYGGQVAAPVFREVATAALRLLDVPKDLPEEAPDEKPGHVDRDDVAIAGLDPMLAPELESSVPPMLVQGPPTSPDQHLFANAAVEGPRAPNFVGKTMRDVIQSAADSGMQVELIGHGVARAQAPLPGTMLPPGEKVRVVFAR